MIQFNQEALDKAIREAWDSTIEITSDKLDSEITDPKWEWNDNTTYRRNGEVVSSPRNIVDTEELLDSKVISRSSRGEVEFEWVADYALLQHEGWVSKSGSEQPARPWTEQPLSEVIDTFKDELSKRLK